MSLAVRKGNRADGSYDAAEDNELSFKEGDKITEIDKVDENWWQGKANGATGLFPGMYISSDQVEVADIQPPMWLLPRTTPHSENKQSKVELETEILYIHPNADNMSQMSNTRQDAAWQKTANWLND